VLFTEYPIGFVPGRQRRVNCCYLWGQCAQVVTSFFDLHAVVGTASTLKVEGNLASRILTLHACTILLETNYALQAEALFINLVQSDCGLGGDGWTWDPCGTAEMNPLELSWDEAWV